MKLLSIGNSFSQDAHKWLHQLAEACGIELETINLYIGGCSLQTHWENLVGERELHEVAHNGGDCEGMTSIQKALKSDNWDVITVQQVSQYSGMPETYEPYLSNLVAFIREACPNAKLYFHQTWAYETDSDHFAFPNYECDQHLMFTRIISTSQEIAAKIGADIIPVGTVIQYLRENEPIFDYANGGLSLCRDGFHLSLDYGRFAAAATWLRTLTGKRVEVSSFGDFDSEKVIKILAGVNQACAD